MPQLPLPVTVTDMYLRNLLLEVQLLVVAQEETNTLLRELLAQRELDRQAIVAGAVELQAVDQPAVGKEARPGVADTAPAAPPPKERGPFRRR